ncbi:HAMP domain-containing histidine kinase [candidate division KSB1 bacterium]|nr:HAMP domain-containing histidine kinase [candidate division KSB1 bacterium]
MKQDKSKNRRTFQLLTRTTAIYLLFTFIAFYGSALFLTNEADQFIHSYLKHRFDRAQGFIQREMREGEEFNKLPYSAEIVKLPQPVDSTLYPVYADTLVHNAAMDEMLRFRKRISIFNINNQQYKLTMIKQMDDFYQLRDDIFGSIIPAFIMLAVGIVLFNLLLSRSIFKPFNRILGIMKMYKIGTDIDVEHVNTSTAEFVKMQQLFHNMLDRIEYDYRHLKEYTENMAHEIQTPLTVIRNKTENLIADDDVMERQASAVKIIYDETNYLSRLGNTLNLLTKIENGEFNKVEELITKPIIEKHVEAVAELARLKSLQIEHRLDAMHKIMIDPFLLDIVIKNLLRNAIRYGTNEGPIRIVTETDSLNISNYGPPLDVSPEKLFERFYRNGNPQASLGLGLSLVKKICELNQMDITYQYDAHQHIFHLKQSDN